MYRFCEIYFVKGDIQSYVYLYTCVSQVLVNQVGHLSLYQLKFKTGNKADSVHVVPGIVENFPRIAQRVASQVNEAMKRKTRPGT